LAVAASLLLIVGLWRLFSSQAAVTSIAKQNEVSSPDNARPQTPQQVAAVEPSTGSKLRGPSTVEREDIDLNKLPFDPNTSQSNEVPRVVALANQAASPWADQAIVAWIDGQFADLWNKQRIEPPKPVSDEELATRLAQVLTGQAQAARNAPPVELAPRMLRSVAFAEHWADRTVEILLRDTPVAKSTDPTGMALRAALAQQIVARKPWNEILGQWIGSEPGRPEAAFLTSLAGASNHRLASRVGSVVLDEALLCARCHDASDNGRVISMEQDHYWSLVGMFKGLENQPAKPDSQSTFVDRQTELFAEGKSPSLFFDRPDGRLQAAQYRLPGGDNWRTLEGSKTPRQSLAQWVATTPVSDHAAINLAWRIVFGRPLVAQHVVLDGAGLPERRQILTTLAEQFQAHGRDMSQLVGWLVASRPFAAEPLNVERQDWLLASDSQLAQWNTASSNFAFFADVSSQRGLPLPAPSLESTLLTVARWSNNRDDRRTMLAQPKPVAPRAVDKIAKPSVDKSQADDPAVRYLLRAMEPSESQKDLIRRLVSSRLTWPQQVEHIANLIGDTGNNARLQRAADQLLESKNGDRSAALFQLLQSVILYDESL